ncbi:SET and MYND domain-containing protein 4-like [Nasonia vitripennis]|uniref:SET and MYND domain-containing protein 4 n=1 Tax=Nasonia vitripennis TaxID=7425 RepID=A0A7M7GEI5_NASVI|nr:SET and MYND domain-containing protein 4-like [Nasonia vitripennis]
MDTECKAVINLIINSKKFQKIMKQSCIELTLKNSKVAEALRKQSNIMFASKNHNSQIHEEIWKYYSMSIAYALHNSKAMAIAYANRSAILAHIEEYEASVKDIKIAVKIADHPTPIIKLLCRKAWCLHRMGSDEKMYPVAVAKAMLKNVKNETDKKNLNELIEGTKVLMDRPMQQKETVIDRTLLNLEELYKKHVVNDFSAVKIEHDEKWGRHLVATRDIKPGEVIYVEEPYTKCLTIKHLRAYCSHCLTTTWSNVPCDHCSWTMFCSEACKDLAWKNYHSSECPVYVCSKSDTDDTCKQLAIRCIALGIKEAGSVENLKAQIKSFDECQDVTKGFLKNEKIQSMGFMSIYALSKNISLENLQTHLENTAIVLRALAEHTTWLEEKCDFNDCKRLKKNENAIFLAALFLTLSKIAHVNKHEMWNSSFCRNNLKRLECWKNECCSRGVYLAPITALLNHSCDPNARRCYSLDHKVIVYATKPIKKGSQIFDCYQEEFYERCKAEERCNMLSSTYNFDCDCKACTQEWPNLIGLTKLYNLHDKHKPVEKLLSLEYKNIIPSTLNRNRVYTYEELLHVANGIDKTLVVLDQPSFLTTNLIICLNKIFDKMYGIKLDVTRKCNNH